MGRSKYPHTPVPGFNKLPKLPGQKKDDGKDKGRSKYPHTPVPASIVDDKENAYANQQVQRQVKDLARKVSPCAKVLHFVTPNQSFNKVTVESTPQVSFNLGKDIVGTGTPSEASSFLEQALPEETPDFMHTNACRGDGNGASNVATPILTPVPDAANMPKPFTFNWNHK